MIYQGQEQSLSGPGVPLNREALWHTLYSTTSPLYLFTSLMNSIRRHAIDVNADYLSYRSHVIYSDNDTIAFRKGQEGRQVVAVYTSSGEGKPAGEASKLDLPTAYTSGSMVTDLVHCKNYTVNEYGQLTVEMGGGEPLVFFPAGKLNGSRLCGFGEVSLEVLMQGGAVSGRRGLRESFAALVVGVGMMAFWLV